MDLVSIRVARPSDAATIFAVLAEVASEIPVRLDGMERQNAIRSIVAECCKGKISWVALDEDRKVVGFLLSQIRSTDSAGMEFSGVELLYGGMLKANRSHGQFSALLQKAKSLGTPLYAVVKHTNSGSMVARLTKAGFSKQEMSLFPDEIALIWTQS